MIVYQIICIFTKNKYMWLINKVPFLRWVYVQIMKKPLKNKISEVVDDYEELIQEFYRVQNKTSKLSRSKRDLVQQRVAHLVSKGHIKVNK